MKTTRMDLRYDKEQKINHQIYFIYLIKCIFNIQYIYYCNVSRTSQVLRLGSMLSILGKYCATYDANSCAVFAKFWLP